LTAGIAHEINNPLTYLLLNLDMLERIAVRFRRGQAPPDELDTRLGEVRQAAERVSDIVRDLRAFSRSGQDTPTRVELGEVVRAGLKMVNNELRHRARLEVDIGPAPPVVADERRLIQVLLNLVTNALQALPETHTEDNWVHVRVAAEDRGAILTVSDSGPGIAPDVLRRIFDPFFTTKPVGEGTGLGLSIARGIVRSYGGTIRAERASAGGTTFRVWLPAAPSDAAAAARETVDTEAAAEGPRLRILVVDDEPLIAAAVRAVLSPPHEVEVVTRAEDAVAVVTRGTYDLILCDLMMPGMSGIDIYESVAAHAPELADRFVFMTGGAFTRRASDFLARCGRPYIAKPFDHADLDRLVRPLSGT
ncbi:MAG TPA: ATP-binding protein, partial [Kofleriaceae bacterium]|nr:ATP-binding protein [Kofleriaceae bacterium]